MHRFLPALLLGAALLFPPAAQAADTVLIVLSGEGRDAGKTRPGYEFDELSQAWLIFKANGLAVEVASPQGGPVEPDKYNPDEPFNAQLLADDAAMAQLAATRPSPHCVPAITARSMWWAAKARCSTCPAHSHCSS